MTANLEPRTAAPDPRYAIGRTAAWVGWAPVVVHSGAGDPRLARSRHDLLPRRVRVPAATRPVAGFPVARNRDGMNNKPTISTARNASNLLFPPFHLDLLPCQVRSGCQSIGQHDTSFAMARCPKHVWHGHKARSARSARNPSSVSFPTKVPTFLFVRGDWAMRLRPWFGWAQNRTERFGPTGPIGLRDLTQATTRWKRSGRLGDAYLGVSPKERDRAYRSVLTALPLLQSRSAGPANSTTPFSNASKRCIGIAPPC